MHDEMRRSWTRRLFWRPSGFDRQPIDRSVGMAYWSCVRFGCISPQATISSRPDPRFHPRVLPDFSMFDHCRALRPVMLTYRASVTRRPSCSMASFHHSLSALPHNHHQQQMRNSSVSQAMAAAILQFPTLASYLYPSAFPPRIGSKDIHRTLFGSRRSQPPCTLLLAMFQHVSYHSLPNTGWTTRTSFRSTNRSLGIGSSRSSR